MSDQFDEYDVEDPRVRAYIDFARSKRPRFTYLAEARSAFHVATQQIARIEATYGGCDWCDECGGGLIELGDRCDERDAARKYLAEHGEEVEERPVCHWCWHAEATEDLPQPGDHGGWCGKCAAAARARAAAVRDACTS